MSFEDVLYDIRGVVWLRFKIKVIKMFEGEGIWSLRLNGERGDKEIRGSKCKVVVFVSIVVRDLREKLF